MNTSEIFQEFLDNIKISGDKATTISDRYGKITKAMNKHFRDTESTTSNSLQVGSYGRYSGIKGISPLPHESFRVVRLTNLCGATG